VASLSEKDLEEVYFLRRAIEEGAVRLAIARASDATIAEMYDRLEEAEAAYERDDLPAAWEADMAFHRSYCRMSGNGRLTDLFEDLASQTVLLMRTALATHASLAWTPPLELHRRIADAIRARDVDAAVRAVGEHYQYTQDRLAADTSVRPEA
jgi:DNA-binding GntR family transcriptional regulator